MRLLETSGLTKRFGGLTVMNDLDFFIEEGEIKGFLGPNGAGKSTFFNLITGVHTPTSGHIIYGGKDITKAKPHQVAKMGIGRTFQLNPLFGDFTVFENVTAAYHMRPHSTIGQVFFNTKTYRENEKYIAMSATSWPRTCPTATRRAWAWPGRWPPSPSCCCWTSRWAA